VQARATGSSGSAGANAPGLSTWVIGADLEIVLPTLRRAGSPQSVLLRWQPQPGLLLEIARAYDAYGNLLDQGATAGADWPGSAPP